jgi:hypothetical protein
LKLFHFFFFLFTVSLCIASILVFTGIYLAQQAGYGSALEAYKLQDKPEQYFVLDNPDQYVMKALSYPNSVVFIDLDKTQIDDIIQSRGTNNFVFEGSYYKIQFLSVDPAVFDHLVLLIITWIVWGIVASAIAIFNYKKKSKSVK